MSAAQIWIVVSILALAVKSPSGLLHRQAPRVERAGSVGGPCVGVCDGWTPIRRGSHTGLWTDGGRSDSRRHRHDPQVALDIATSTTATLARIKIMLWWPWRSARMKPVWRSRVCWRPS